MTSGRLTGKVALIPNAGGADYDCSKGALRNLTSTLALELAPLRINVNNLASGMVLTKRAATPAEIARLAVFLASSDADYMTGSTYGMDGGLMQNLGRGA